tara:strand:- start:333 stop:530 length:198 start_codon:yes stop_codon:yes gene_type:complete
MKSEKNFNKLLSGRDTFSVILLQALSGLLQEDIDLRNVDLRSDGIPKLGLRYPVPPLRSQLYRGR